MSGATGSRIGNVSAALLLGGASTRMGRDKAHLELDGVPAATRLARLLSGLFEEVLLVGGDPPGDAPGRRIQDPAGPRCALRGFLGALSAAHCDEVLVVATDQLGLSAELVLALLARPVAQVVAPRSAGLLQPLCALYRRDAALAVVRDRFARGQLSLKGVLEALDVGVLEGADLAAVDPAGDALRNVNTPEELADLESRRASVRS